MPPAGPSMRDGVTRYRLFGRCQVLVGVGSLRTSPSLPVQRRREHRVAFRQDPRGLLSLVGRSRSCEGISHGENAKHEHALLECGHGKAPLIGQQPHSNPRDHCMDLRCSREIRGGARGAIRGLGTSGAGDDAAHDLGLDSRRAFDHFAAVISPRQAAIGPEIKGRGLCEDIFETMLL